MDKFFSFDEHMKNWYNMIGFMLGLGEKDSDCGTTHCVKVLLTNDNYEDYLYRYIQDNNELVLLTNDNYIEYLNRIIEIRSVMFCENEKFCNKCLGELPYLGIKGDE